MRARELGIRVGDLSPGPQNAITDVEGVSVVIMIDDQAAFESAYPQARTQRDGLVYPRRVHRVAAARRAHQLEAAGGSARIAVADK